MSEVVLDAGVREVHLVEVVDDLRTASKGSVLATKVLKPQGTGGVLAGKAVKTRKAKAVSDQHVDLVHPKPLERVLVTPHDAIVAVVMSVVEL